MNFESRLTKLFYGDCSFLFIFMFFFFFFFFNNKTYLEILLKLYNPKC